MRRIALLAALFVATLSSVSASEIDVMLLTGKNDKHHKCEFMAPALVELFGEEELFDMEVVKFTSPEEFAPKFKRADVVIINLNNVEWSDECKHDFERYVKRGGGVVIIHEADNAFPEWEAYNRMIGLGGWGGRTKASGGYYYYKDGAMVYDTESEGRSGHHGRAGDFVINNRAPEHPIMKGLPTSWTHHKDELYGDMRGPAIDVEVLATAYSNPATRGTGKEEPVLFTIRYGKGRIFHTVLGHTGKGWDQVVARGVVTSIVNEGFKTTLLRGTEWAATGKVTQSRTSTSTK